MAGTYHDSAKHGYGSGANYLCLADRPTWGHYATAGNNDIRIAGVEYEFSGYSINEVADFFGTNIRHNEAPCAVCHSSRTSNLMIPGRTDCYPGWTKEYNGFLVGAYPGYNDATEFVCLDRRPESVVNSGIGDGENLLYFVEANCGKSLECPPYVHDRELACVVCSA
ncbi:uncharacterized protein LOC123532677 [Mercenaria mercenaria]|uniref:uncharacterized protein LOC123532677 n=1 Tax=Mercenaria mercenaria TaxID=6596 RepID=UPI00234E998A|nr:uncharacterized protein LOC123532677 [Mercenaria mercenaria]